MIELNAEAAAKYRKKRMLKRVIYLLPPVVLFTLAVFFSADYLARLPRERSARDYSYWERVKLGARRAFKATYLTLTAYHPDPKKTALPIAEIYIKGKKIDELNSALPESGKKFKKGRFKIDKEEYKASLRYKGDSINHWAFPNKSWRVKLLKGKDYKNEDLFNLNVPRTETQIANWLGYKMASLIMDEGDSSLLVPDAKFVHFRVNRNFNGLRLWLEQPGPEFLVKRGLWPGKIYNGDIDSSQIYGGRRRKPLYGDVSAWKVDGPEVDTSPTEMLKLIRLIKNQKPYDFYYNIFNLVDVDAVLKYMALLDLVSSVHIDNTHNNKYYLNPLSGQLTPIVWDTVAYFWKNQIPVDIPSNELFKKLLAIPSLREKKDKYLWKWIHKDLSKNKLHSLIEETTLRIRPELFSFPLKLHASASGIRNLSNSEWQNSVKELHSIIEERHNYIIKALSDTNVSFNFLQSESNSYLLGIQVKSRAGIRLKNLVLELEDSTSRAEVVLNRVGIKDIGKEIKPVYVNQRAKASGGVVSFDLDDTLYSKRQVRRQTKLVPGTYVFSLTATNGAKIKNVKQLTGVNSVTGRPYALRLNSSLKVPIVHRKDYVWWDPEQYAQQKTVSLSGQVAVNKDLVIDRYSRLTVAPGTTVSLAPGISIIINGSKASFNGTAKAPVVLKAADPEKSWGVLGVFNGSTVKISHTSFEGAGDGRYGTVFFPAALSLFESKGTIEESKFIGEYISADHAELNIKNTSFKIPWQDPVCERNSHVIRRNITVSRLKPLLSRNILDQTAYGTPERVEREFKYSLIQNDDSKALKLKEIASGISKALETALKNNPGWKAPSHTGTAYYTDAVPKKFAFRDIYFDTADDLALRHSISYRLRNRYSNLKDYKRHIKEPGRFDYWPYRLEFQAKVDRIELGEGFSTVRESRFEFRKESLPFSDKHLPPPPPWDLDEFIPYFQMGRYKDLWTIPAKSVMNFVKDKTDAEELYFEPRLVLLTERFRQHLNIKSDFGSGPNPEQVFIISLDHSQAFDADPYLHYLKSVNTAARSEKPVAYKAFTEIEVEFERNVSEVLDKKINESAAAGLGDDLKQIRKAFLSDQKLIMKVIKDYFADRGIKLLPANKSKYAQAAVKTESSKLFR